MLDKIFNRKSSSSDENETTENSLNNSVIGPSVSSEQTSSSLLSKKRNRSSTDSVDDIKRQNVNGSFLLELDNMPSVSDTTAEKIKIAPWLPLPSTL